MSSTKQWPLIKGKARVWSNGQLQCHYCLGLFNSSDQRRCYCGQECRNSNHNDARRKTRLESRRCGVCGRSFEPRTYHQHWCSPRCRKLAFYRRRHGLPVDPIKALQVTKDRLHKFPPDEEAHREWRRAQRLSRKRYEVEDQQTTTEPCHRQIEIIDPAELLPDSLVGRINEMLANQTLCEQH